MGIFQLVLEYCFPIPMQFDVKYVRLWAIVPKINVLIFLLIIDFHLSVYVWIIFNGQFCRPDFDSDEITKSSA